jgi:hypothetical protein
MEYVFKKPYEFEGKTYDKLELDLDSLSGADISAVKKLYAAGGNFSPIPATDSDFCIMLAARLIKQPVEFFNAMPARDYCAIAQGVSNFLLG